MYYGLLVEVLTDRLMFANPRGCLGYPIATLESLATQNSLGLERDIREKCASPGDAGSSDAGSRVNVTEVI